MFDVRMFDVCMFDYERKLFVIEHTIIKQQYKSFIIK